MAQVNGKKSAIKPEKPDEEVYKAKLKKAEKEHAESMARLSIIKSKLDCTIPSSSESPMSKHRTELLNQLKEIREKQSVGKTSRNKILDQIKKEDSIVKDLMSQQKTARSRVNFKSIEDLEREIEKLNKQVNAGTMRIVDEKKAIDAISLLHKQRKNFSGFEESQRAIDARKGVIKQLRDQLDDPENKALSEKYNQIQAELDAIKAEQEDVYKNISSLRDERKKLQDDQQVKYLAIKEIKDNYYEQNRAVQRWEYEARQRAREKKKAEEERYQQEKRKARAQQILTEASDKAFLEEIRRAHSLLRFLDPTYVTEKPPPLQTVSKLHAIPTRQVDGPEIKGIRISKKEEEDYFPGTGGKKAKKSRKLAAKESLIPAKYSCPPAVMEDCTFMGIDPPMSSADIPAVKEKVLAKLNYWKTNQDAETEKNIAKAKKELERLEAEESMASSSPTHDQAPTLECADSKPISMISEDENIKNKTTLEESSQIDVAAEIQAVSLED